MSVSPPPPPITPARRLMSDVALLVFAGIALGFAFNYLQRSADPARGLPWIRHERVLLKLDDGPPPQPAPQPLPVAGAAMSRPAGPSDSAARAPAPKPHPAGPRMQPAPAGTPAASAPPAASAAAASEVPPIPDAPEPVEVRLVTVQKLHAAHAAVFVDARGADEYAVSHIAGAVNIPFDEAFKDPARLKRFEAGGRPIVTYCGGGDCDLSRNLAFSFIDAGQHRVAVYLGGLPEWQKAGLPIATGAKP